MKNYLKDNRGFTMIEMVVILAVVAILSAVLTPMTIGYIKDAKLRRAEADVKVIGAAIQTFNRDLREWPIWSDQTDMNDNAATYDTLSSEAGDVPLNSGSVAFELTADDSLDDQLVTNDPTYTEDPTARRKWLGPYMENINEDPWGNKYYVYLAPVWPANLSSSSPDAVFVISAGPNEDIETATGQDASGFTVGGDDIVFRIR